MSKRPTFAVLLPTTAYILRLEPPPARRFIQGNILFHDPALWLLFKCIIIFNHWASVPVALGSDFNPNAHCLSMPLVMHLACVNLRLTMNEALVAATINAAGTTSPNWMNDSLLTPISFFPGSLNKSASHGSLEVGKVGDMLILDAPKWEHLIYQLGDPPIEKVIKRGKVV